MISAIKIGGNVIDSPQNLESFLKKFIALPDKKILIHGGGKLATALAQKLGIPVRMTDGRRITDAETIDIVTMVYAGLINKKITAALQSSGCNAIGLSGADAGLIRAVKRNPEPVDFGFVGDIPSDGIDVERLTSFTDAGLVPVLCSIVADKHGVLLNCNADAIARSLATALAASGHEVRLIYCFEKLGLLSDVNDETTLVSSITSENCERLKSEGVISGGMIPKTDNAFAALKAGVREVAIKSWQNLDNDTGTLIRL
jgi:acetylglutamate kinase